MELIECDGEKGMLETMLSDINGDLYCCKVIIDAFDERIKHYTFTSSEADRRIAYWTAEEDPTSNSVDGMIRTWKRSKAEYAIVLDAFEVHVKDYKEMIVHLNMSKAQILDDLGKL